jgi:hypothetical protein
VAAVSEQTHPDLSGCRPLACRNVGPSADNVAAWQAELEGIDKQLCARPSLPPLLPHRLQARERKLRSIWTATLGTAMSRRAEIPDKTAVFGALAELSTETTEIGKRPSAAALAQRLGLSNTTFWRHYPDVAREVASNRRNRHGDDSAKTQDHRRQLEKQNADLRSANRLLSEQAGPRHSEHPTTHARESSTPART